MTVVLNLSDSAYECEIDGKVLIISGGALDSYNGKKVIPARSCAWFMA
jgi:hypothetical protein